MTEDSYANLQGESEVDSGMSPVTNSDKSLVGESCSQACKVHWPLRLLSIAIVAGGLGLYGLLEFAPGITNLIPESMIRMVGLDSGQQLSKRANSTYREALSSSAVNALRRSSISTAH